MSRTRCVRFTRFILTRRPSMAWTSTWHGETRKSGVPNIICCGPPRPTRKINRSWLPDADIAGGQTRNALAGRRVVGIDFSATSVRATEELKRKYSLANLEVRQLPIARADELEAPFDQIVCTGVLHHLPDPDAGLGALRDVLKPDGAMNIMVYAPYGRTGIYMLQEFCKRIGIGATAGEIRDLVKALSHCQPGTRCKACSASPRISGTRRHLPTRCCTRAIAHIRSRSYSIFSNGVA